MRFRSRNLLDIALGDKPDGSACFVSCIEVCEVDNGNPPAMEMPVLPPIAPDEGRDLPDKSVWDSCW